MKKDEQLPAMSEGQQIAFNGAECTKKQTEPPARYSQGKLIQEMEKLGLGTKSTRHSIIERLYTCLLYTSLRGLLCEGRAIVLR